MWQIIMKGHKGNEGEEYINAFTNAINELTSAISLQIGQMFVKAMVVYGLSTIIFSTIDAICDNFDLCFF